MAMVCLPHISSPSTIVRAAKRAPKQRSRTFAATATTTVVSAPARLFTDEEWEQAAKEAVQLAAAYAASTAVGSESSVAVSSVPAPGKLFSDADWEKAFQLAASQNPLLYNSVSATGEAAVLDPSTATPAYPPPPPGRVFSDEEWSDAFGASAQGVAALSTSADSQFPAPPPGRVFSDEAWMASMKLASAGKVSDEPAPTPKPFSEVMAFSGPAPEAVNGRLAMLGFIAAFAAELASAEPVAAQYGDVSGGVNAAVVLLAAASLIPLLKGTTTMTMGPFTPQAEQLNGRAAMVGFAAMLVMESIGGSALF